jgi:drug/metabolite transporter (DMT)-like permease
VPARPAGRRLLPRLALFGATFVWGATFAVIQRAIADLPVFHLIALRFTFATLLLLPLARGTRLTPRLWRDGLVVGGLLFAGFALQTSGLLWTTPSRSAFLTGLSVVFVPFLGRFAGRPLHPGPVAGSLCAAVGLWVLYRPGTGTASAPFNRGDLLTCACALAFALYVLAVEGAVRRHRVRSLAVLQFGTVAALSLPSLLLQPMRRAEFTPYAVTALLVTGILGTALAFLCQLYAQRHLSAVEAGVIFTFEPVIAAAVSVVLGIEPWTLGLTLGGLFVVAAMLITEIWGGPEDVAPPAAATPRS